ncbi:cell wall hydrolase/autolysin [Desulfovibrio sp. X2]|uniref:N-acetylmuramoyl-L-alanine amidase n=1 Tax=Desulfovibrio sp. X2 TaxID=941449 RepID=UPI000358A6B5|nr:N-acetylmuramoyl-L-alanine amidase [Desulfovibrio sp. X2]EPR44530.1 cell wall hydrolase/autolysin [Desulfovibrio sp. X2]
MRGKRHAISIVLMTLGLVLLWCGGLWAASLQRQFNTAYTDFHSLDRSKKRSAQRSEWLAVQKEFLDIYTSDPGGSFAPKALYYVGRVNEELGQRSRLAGDYENACDYFQRMVSRFPSHPWADDCLYRKAEINLRHLNRPDRAYADLLILDHKYTKGDMHAKAQALLREIDAKHAGGAAPAAAGAKSSGRKKDADKAADTLAASIVSGASASDSDGGDAPGAAAAADSSGASSQGGSVTLDHVRWHSSDEYTRVVLDLSGEARFKWQLLAANPDADTPHRLYIDLLDTGLSKSSAQDKTVRDGILKQIRTAQNTPDTVRVVLDFNKFQDYKLFQLYDPYRVVVDVYAPRKGQPAKAVTAAASGDSGPTSAKSARESASRSKSRSRSRSGKGAMNVASSREPEPITPGPSQRKHSESLIEQLGLSVDTIMIDPGHGGKDSGAIGAGGLYEKNVVLRAAKILGAKLEARGFHVVYTRSTDKFIPLEERTAMANVRKADLFISLHCNAADDSSAKGLEVYSLNLAKTKDAVRVAARENAVTAKRISDLQVILTDLMLNSKVKESKDLAGDVQGGILRSVRKTYPLHDRRQREAPFYVLMGAKMPAILVEMGYITNPTEARKLDSDSYLDDLCDGIVAGVGSYKRTIERYASR